MDKDPFVPFIDEDEFYDFWDDGYDYFDEMFSESEDEDFDDYYLDEEDY